MTAEHHPYEEPLGLEALCALAVKLQHGTASTSHPPQQVMDVVLAAFVARNLTNGGFVQLFFNAGGEYLAEMAQMFQNFNASNTLRFYEQTVRICLADKKAYQDFLAGDFVSASPFKNALHEVSLGYFAAATHFEDEAQPLLGQACTVAARWLQGQGGASS